MAASLVEQYRNIIKKARLLPHAQPPLRQQKAHAQKHISSRFLIPFAACLPRTVQTPLRQFMANSLFNVNLSRGILTAAR
jgi:hypothetical protein